MHQLWYIVLSYQRGDNSQCIFVLCHLFKAIGTNAKESHQKVVISTNGIPEFHQMSVTSQGLWCGAAVTISQLEQETHRLLLSEDKQKTRVLKALIDILKFYACTQIKNLAVRSWFVLLFPYCIILIDKHSLNQTCIVNQPSIFI